MPIEFIDSLRAASEKVAAFWKDRLVPVATEVWEQVLLPALESGHRLEYAKPLAPPVLAAGVDTTRCFADQALLPGG